MKNETTFRKNAGLLAIISCPLALLSLMLIFAAFNWDFELAFDPVRAIAFQPDPSDSLRWGWILDIFGYYLPIVPLILVLHSWLSPGSELSSQLYTISGLGYVLIGATGAAMLAGATVPLYESYATGDAVQQAIATQVYANLSNEVASGIWNIFIMTLAAVWFLGTGFLLRPKQRWLGVFTISLGIACILDVLGYILQNEALSMTGLNYYLFLAPVWAAWTGWVIWRKV